MRVKPNISLAQIFQRTCEEKNLDPYKYELQHPTEPDIALNMAESLNVYKITEINLVSASGKNSSLWYLMFISLMSWVWCLGWHSDFSSVFIQVKTPCFCFLMICIAMELCISIKLLWLSTLGRSPCILIHICTHIYIIKTCGDWSLYPRLHATKDRQKKGGAYRSPCVLKLHYILWDSLKACIPSFSGNDLRHHDQCLSDMIIMYNTLWIHP